jgi:hypothetical protein
MKKYFILFIVLLISFSVEQVKADVYASGLRISDDTVSTYHNAPNTWDQNFANGGVKIWFIINEAGIGTLSATVTVKQGATVIRTLTVANPQKGVNSVIWDGYTNASAAAPVGSYTFEVFVSDPVGHSAFDSMWVAGAFYQGPDPDGGTGYAYRGNASIKDQNTVAFGNLYVAKGSASDNGLYEFRADGQYVRKIGTDPVWTASVPNEVVTLGNTVWALAGYGFVGAGYTRGFSANTGNLLDSLNWGTNAVRGLFVRYEGGDTAFYTTRSGTAGQNAIIKKVGVNGPVQVALDMNTAFITTTGYLKDVVIDDGNNFWVIYGNTSATRNRIARFNSLGVPFFDSSLVQYGFAAGAYISSIAYYRGTDNSTIADDKIYFLIVNAGTSSGIYQMDFGGQVLTQRVTPAGITTAATSQIIDTDAAGNVIWSNGASQERIVAFSPANGPNSRTTPAPQSLPIVVSQIVPVELTAFTYSVAGNSVKLSWTTATELNNRGFEVEKMVNSNWQSLGFVAGSGTTTEQRSYNFVDQNVSAGSYLYRLKQIDYDGTVEYSDAIEVDVNVPAEFTLNQNYPNPFNPSTTISFSIPVDAHVQLVVYSMTGELVEMLVNEVRGAGNHNISFNASGLASGTYVYRLSAGDVNITKKMILMK